MKTRTYVLGAFAVVLVAALIMVNLWAGDEADRVPPLESAALATAGLVDASAREKSQHLGSAQDGFFLVRAWHWWRYTSLTSA